jgi:hypothetical protein
MTNKHFSKLEYNWKGIEDLLDVLQVLFPTFATNEDVVQIYNHKRIGEWSQDIIHQYHEHCWRISQAKRHDQPFEKTLLRLEANLPNIILFD